MASFAEASLWNPYAAAQLSLVPGSRATTAGRLHGPAEPLRRFLFCAVRAEAAYLLGLATSVIRLFTKQAQQVRSCCSKDCAPSIWPVFRGLVEQSQDGVRVKRLALPLSLRQNTNGKR